MNVLITGANGFLGHYLTRLLLDLEYDVIATGKGECRLPFEGEKGFTYQPLDFTNPFEVHDVFERYDPWCVVHAGAMSKPDECEADQWKAYLVNVESTVSLLLNAEEYRCFFIFISTDFVFPGETGMYSEDDPREPVNFYGQTKMDAEDAVMEYPFDWAIVRTVLVYGEPLKGRTNILKIVEDKLRKGEKYRVVNDQVRTPTYVGDLARAIALIMIQRATGVYHISGSDVLTPYEMACAAAEYLGLDKKLLEPVTVSDFRELARRPLKTGFNISRAKKELGFEPVSFREGLELTFPGK